MGKEVLDACALLLGRTANLQRILAYHNPYFARWILGLVATVRQPALGATSDPRLRSRIAQYELDAMCFGLTLRRSGEEAKAGQGAGAATSMFKLYASEMNKRRAEIQMATRGASALGWEGDGFSADELMETRGWLRSKGNSIEGGTSEVQLNVIAKRVLGLPD